LRQQRAHASRIFALPALELDHESDREQQLGATAFACPGKHQPTRDQRLDGRRESIDAKHASRLHDAMQELPSCFGQAGRIARFRQADERSCNLCRLVDAFTAIDGDAKTFDDGLQLASRQQTQHLFEPEGSRASRHR